MRDERRNYLIVGAFVLAMLAALIAWLAVLSGRTGATDAYSIHYAAVTRIAPGTQVLYQGYPVGLVDRIEPIEAGGRSGFRVDIGVERGWLIPEDSVAEIVSGIFAAVVIDIRAGESDTALAPGSLIASREPADVFAVVSRLAGRVDELIDDGVKPLLDRLVESAPELVDEVRHAVKRVDEVVARVAELVDAENAAHFDRTLANLEETSANAADLTRDLGGSREKLDALIVSLEGVVQDNEPELSRAIADLRDALDAVARHANAIAHNLESASRDVSEFSSQLRDNPNVILWGRQGPDDEATDR